MRNVIVLFILLTAGTTAAQPTKPTPRPTATRAAAGLTFAGTVPAPVRQACERAYARLPQAWRVPVTVRVQSLSGSKGRYYAATNTVALSRTLRVAGPTLVHEVGHAVHVGYLYGRPGLTMAQATDWEQFWRANRRRMPTAYARTNSGEGFATCLERRYGRGKPLNPVLTARLDRYLRESGEPEPPARREPSELPREAPRPLGPAESHAPEVE